MSIVNRQWLQLADAACLTEDVAVEFKWVRGLAKLWCGCVHLTFLVGEQPCFPFNATPLSNNCKSYEQIAMESAVGEIDTGTIGHCKVGLKFPNFSNCFIPLYGVSFGKYRAAGFLQVDWNQGNSKTFTLHAACKGVKDFVSVPNQELGLILGVRDYFKMFHWCLGASSESLCFQ